MEIVGDYPRDGYAHVKGLIAPEIAQATLQALREAIGPRDIPLSGVRDHPNLLRRAAFEVYGHHYRPILHFLWGLTPQMSAMAGKDLLPTYSYLRIYREGDVCRVHCDRYSCEHSMSLTLDYSDGVPWALEVDKDPQAPSARVEEGFDTDRYASIPMAVGDAVLYRGVDHRHGRVTPNPNGWSAHLFLHWVDRNGPYAEHAFDGQMKPAPVDFSFA
ncbi:hypothetical protein P6144_15740 [Sphingomonas sp. HITSZ_GF]|uniref:hypothetical protein n=1 Tax=Sphingomonas sp. HITSZ_GF TaxID=3037247 RepID=UPI00240D11CF|nr:hypothetical protein [Sphingomonas sp. HITSZ_GF]MDG2535112.1 hypothetical protein [Sphingomonas sp. HITSZ_GF]